MGGSGSPPAARCTGRLKHEIVAGDGSPRAADAVDRFLELYDGGRLVELAGNDVAHDSGHRFHVEPGCIRPWADADGQPERRDERLRWGRTERLVLGTRHVFERVDVAAASAARRSTGLVQPSIWFVIGPRAPPGGSGGHLRTVASRCVLGLVGSAAADELFGAFRHCDLVVAVVEPAFGKMNVLG